MNNGFEYLTSSDLVMFSDSLWLVDSNGHLGLPVCPHFTVESHKNGFVVYSDVIKSFGCFVIEDYEIARELNLTPMGQANYRQCFRDQGFIIYDPLNGLNIFFFALVNYGAIKKVNEPASIDIQVVASLVSLAAIVEGRPSSKALPPDFESNFKGRA